MGKRRGNSRGGGEWKRGRGVPGSSGVAGEEPPRDFEGDGRGLSAAQWKDLVKENAWFEAVYRALLPAGEGDAFMAAVRRPLPSTFRISPVGHFTHRIQLLLREVAEEMDGAGVFPIRDEETGEVIASGPPRQLGRWDPTAWTSGTDRVTLRRRPELKKLHVMLVRASETGAVARQELVSMVPPLVLMRAIDKGENAAVSGTGDLPLPGLWLLDLCAAPGSKTLQLLEMLEMRKRGGVLVANDVDAKRAYMLTKRVSALRSPSMMVSTHDGTTFPHLEFEQGGSFHGVLCDVPCSGDGTIRKNPELWGTFHPKDAVHMHSMQIRIALRGMSMLKKGGVLVYSTCSMSPLEDEAVVCELLREGGFELVEFAPDDFPELVRRPGLGNGKWAVPVVVPERHPKNSTGKPWLKFFTSMAEFEEFAGTDKSPQDQGLPPLRGSMFPPPNVESFHLERCLRFFPHDQDSGGFFACALRRLTDHSGLSAKTQARIAAADAPVSRVDQEMITTRRPNKVNIHPQDVWYDPVHSDVWASVCEDWGIDPAHPIRECLLARKSGQEELDGQHVARHCPRVSVGTRDLIRVLNLSAMRNGALHVVNAGVIALCRIGKTDVKGAAAAAGDDGGGGGLSIPRYRIMQDGVAVFRPLITKRVVQITLRNVSEAYATTVSSALANGPWSPSILLANLDPAQAALTQSLTAGGLVLELAPEDQARFAQVLGGVLLLSAWWGGKASIATMVDKMELTELFAQCVVTGLIEGGPPPAAAGGGSGAGAGTGTGTGTGTASASASGEVSEGGEDGEDA